MDNIQCDIAVIGAGSAGIAAAMAVAESGLKVVLVERYGFTGGLATSAMVGTICGIYYRTNGRKKTPRFAVQGFAKKFVQGVMAKSNTQTESFAGGLHFIPYQPAVFHYQAANNLKQAGVELMLHVAVVSVKIRAGQVAELVLNAMDSVLCLKPKAVIDCSGNAQIAMLANLSMIKQPYYQAGTFVFKVAGLPQMEISTLSLNLIRWIKRGIESGDLDPQCERLSIVPGTVKQGMAFFKLSLPKLFSADTFQWTNSELEIRSRSVEIIDYLSRAEPLRDLTIVSMATQIGIRTGPRHEGLEVLEEKHVLTCEKPEEGVAIGAWPIEYWGEARKPEMSYFNHNDYYLIPAGTLVSKHLTNLFFAGRTISATERAIASARVIGTCLSTGYAAGMLAVELVQQGVWQTAIEKIRAKQVFSEEA